MDGAVEGDFVGEAVGALVLGAAVRVGGMLCKVEGEAEGLLLGKNEGLGDGIVLGTKDGPMLGVDDGELLGGSLGEVDGNEVVGETLGNGVTSKLTQDPSESQQTLQQRQPSSGGSPLTWARQSADRFSIAEIEEQRTFGTSPDKKLFSRERI